MINPPAFTQNYLQARFDQRICYGETARSCNCFFRVFNGLQLKKMNYGFTSTIHFLSSFKRFSSSAMSCLSLALKFAFALKVDPLFSKFV